MLALAINLILITLFSWFAFARNVGRLLAGNDGPTGYSLADEQLSFFGVTPHLHSNLLEGLGNLALPYNLSIQPAYWLGITPNWIYTWFALQVFISVLLIGWNYQFPTRTRYPAAWLLTILIFPYFETFRIYSITASMPNFISIMLVFALMDIGIQRMGRDDWVSSLFYAGVCLSGFIYGLLTAPALLVLIAPLLFITTISAFLTTSHREVFWRKMTMAVVLLVIVIASGWLEYMAGLMLNAAGIFFNADMHQSGVNTSAAIYASILFQGGYDGMRMGPWLFTAGLLGTLLALVKLPQQRTAALSVLAAQVLIVGGGLAAMKLFPLLLSSLSPIYFEVVLFPFYSLFAVNLFMQVFKLNPKQELVLPVLITIALTWGLFHSPAKRERLGNFALPPHSTAITDILENEIALRPNQAFRGRVANIVLNQNWLDQIHYFATVNNATGNDHQTTGLWLKHIPTLHEYSQTISPGFYRLYRRFLSDGTDHPYRSWSSFNKIDLQMLKLLGVNYIITTTSDIPLAKKLASINMPDDLPALYLFTIKDANINGISAKQIITATNLQDAENTMAAKQYQLTDAIITEKLTEKLNPATSSQITIVPGGIRLQASSQGQTLLILPFEYSHCFQATVHQGQEPKLMRVDVALTGVLFDKNVDVTLDMQTGPFNQPRCRLQDYREFAQLWRS